MLLAGQTAPRAGRQWLPWGPEYFRDLYPATSMYMIADQIIGPFVENLG